MGVTLRHARGAVEEQPRGLPAGPGDPVQARFERRLTPRRGRDADRPAPDGTPATAIGRRDHLLQRHPPGDRSAPRPIPAHPASGGRGDVMVDVFAAVDRLVPGRIRIARKPVPALFGPSGAVGRHRVTAPGAGQGAPGRCLAEPLGQVHAQRGLGDRPGPGRGLDDPAGRPPEGQHSRGGAIHEARDDRVEPPLGWRERAATRGARLVRDGGRSHGVRPHQRFHQPARGRDAADRRTPPSARLDRREYDLRSGHMHSLQPGRVPRERTTGPPWSGRLG